MMFHRSALLMIAAAAILLGGCAESRYIYRPAQQVTATVGSLPAARYGIPSEKPTGEVLIASSGLTALPEADGRTPSLFVRMVVTNNSDETAWKVDTREQIAFIGGQKQSPAYANTFGQPQPVLEIPRGEKRLIDLYYRVAPRVEDDDQMPQFDFAWNVQTAARPIAERTIFDRVRVEPVYASGYPYYGYGYRPYGYYDPFWHPYPYYGGVHIGVGHYWGGGYGGYGGRGYGGGGFRAPYTRAAPSIRR